MAVLGFNHYNLRAPRPLLDELRDYYRDIVGLSEGWRPPFRSFGYWLYAGEKDVLHLSETRADEVRDPSAITTFDHVAFTCVDFDVTLEKLQMNEVDYSIADAPTTRSRQVFFRDPAGNGIELNFQDET